ncbi:hypothetical protein [Anoxynatronum buryatiense]|uniref:Uncharacterized protein n=1 Tax=Anoxynatronum buryatiense TaxID=489973 RepID=A0AA46AJU5_9CLOT|nr:hypothetical protein [Anoxynatronum buryatiense]SMP64386.1 hypothetical protein SAMN06296020_111137 [Anoxynatronum buryatiense]
MIQQTLKDFIDENMELTLHECRECNNLMELCFDPYTILLEGKYINIDRFPQMKCVKCGSKQLTEKSKKVIVYLHDELMKSNKDRVFSNHRHLDKRYPFCTQYDFKYDYEDYENIPGLTALTGDGFLTPVFFDKKALIYFMHDPDYELNLFSETYGNLTYKESFTISFGINTNNRVVMWLGDLDKLNEETLSYLKIHNIDSDHKIVESEFYLAQLCCIFSDPIIEKRLINLRNKFYDLMKLKFSMDLNHLDDEVIAVLDDIRKPITFNSMEVKPVISALHKILIEAISIERLKEFYKSNCTTPNKNFNNWGSVKFIEFILLFISRKDKLDDEMKEMISPLYILNDLRILYFHILSNEKQERIKENIVNSLGINSLDDTETLHINLVDKLYRLYRTLVDGIQKFEQ